MAPQVVQEDVLRTRVDVLRHLYCEAPIELDAQVEPLMQPYRRHAAARDRVDIARAVKSEGMPAGAVEP